VLTDVRDIRSRRFEQVYLTVASTSLSGAWLPQLVEQIGGAVLVSLQPGREDLQRIVQAGAPTERLVAGSIGLLAYTAPLPGELRFAEPGTAYWTPPLARSLFSGSPAHVGRVVAALRRGGLPAGSIHDVHRSMAFPNAVGMTFLLALEAAGWSERALYRGPLMRRYRQAVLEVASIMGHSERRTLHGVRLAGSAAFVHAGFTLGRWLTPLPLEPYLQRHFTKVGPQTRQMISSLIAEGERASLPTGALLGLMGSADEARRAGTAT
jgi:2-dehydropantoate 2-reductase